ncbi:MAG: hypothetical protein LBP59_09720 [Planctomycetaceae bacterium]|nr:hypothetical protein [Planctomycetaceae bacterium]
MVFILLVLEIQRFKSVKACRPKARQAKVNANSSTNSLEVPQNPLLNFRERLQFFSGGLRLIVCNRSRKFKRYI